VFYLLYHGKQNLFLRFSIDRSKIKLNDFGSYRVYTFMFDKQVPNKKLV